MGLISAPPLRGPPLLSRGVTSNLTVHKGGFHQRRQSISCVFKQMAAMGALIVLADESEVRHRVPSPPTLICLLISRRARLRWSWMSAGLEFIRPRVSALEFSSLSCWSSSGPPWPDCLHLLVAPATPPPPPPICRPRLVHISAPLRL